MTEGAEPAPRTRALLLDVEGTTTPVSFVYDVLFPYARRNLHSYLEKHLGDAALSVPVAMLATEWAAQTESGEPVAWGQPGEGDLAALYEYLNELMDRDAKSPGLKLIQGQIWEQGYRNGELRAQVFADVPPAFARWTAAGIAIAIYSSGSALAQRLLFANSDRGDLTPSIARYFDTGIGAKRARESYARIAASLGFAPAEVTFVSDVDAELESARDAGCRVVMCARPGNSAGRSHIAPTVHSFDEIDALL